MGSTEMNIIKNQVLSVKGLFVAWIVASLAANLGVFLVAAMYGFGSCRESLVRARAIGTYQIFFNLVFVFFAVGTTIMVVLKRHQLEKARFRYLLVTGFGWLFSYITLSVLSSVFGVSIC